VPKCGLELSALGAVFDRANPSAARVLIDKARALRKRKRKQGATQRAGRDQRRIFKDKRWLVLPYLLVS
jgi:hypothetical protein